MRILLHIRRIGAGSFVIDGHLQFASANRTVERQSKGPRAWSRLVHCLPLHAQRSTVVLERLGLDVAGARPGADAVPRDSWLAFFLFRPMTCAARQQKERERDDLSPWSLDLSCSWPRSRRSKV